MAKDIHAEIALAKSILIDLEKHAFPKKLSSDGVEIAEYLVSTADAERIFNKDFLTRLSTRLDQLKSNLIKKSSEENEQLQRLAKRLKARR